MRFTQAVRTQKKISSDIESKNHELLVKAGFIEQVGAGIYNYLPLGLSVINKIENIVREEMNRIDGNEILMPALIPKNLWMQTGRWDSVDVLMKLETPHGGEYALGFSHEETITPMAKQFIQSYRDLPLSFYQIATKFRDEARPKSGILRGREFRMKDMYSFHESKESFDQYYKQVIEAYKKVYTRCGLADVKICKASGGDFSKKISHEFNVLTPAGEVDLIYCATCDYAVNAEVVEAKMESCPECKKGTLKTGKAIEVGNIFDLEDKFSKIFELSFSDADGKKRPVLMGCYGIGTSRILGTIVEVYNDNQGIIWPNAIAPAQVTLINLVRNSSSYADLVYRTLTAEGIEVLYDDRHQLSAGERFADCDLIGIPIRLVVSDKTGKDIEIKHRTGNKTVNLSVQDTIQQVKEFYS